MTDILSVHKAINEVLPGTLVGFSIDTFSDKPHVRVSVRFEADGTVWQSQVLFADEAWSQVTSDLIVSWFRLEFKDVL